MNILKGLMTKLNKNLIGNYTYKDICEKCEIFINSELSERKINNLKYLPCNIEINIDPSLIRTIINVIDKLEDLGKNNKVIISFFSELEKKHFIQDIHNYSIENKNVYIKDFILYNFLMPIKDFIDLETKLYDFIKPGLKLSPFEQYIFAYNLTKKIKKYKENKDDEMQSRELYKILQNDYITCAGFSELFGALLYKLGINNIFFSSYVDISYDEYHYKNEDLLLNKPTTFSSHARRYTYIVDEKYKIDGFYIADPTWDNDLESDFYNCLAITNNEAEQSFRMLKFDSNDEPWQELFYINTIHDFYNKINFLLDRKSINIDILLNKLLETINKLDENEFTILKEKYNLIFSKYKYILPNDKNKLSDLIHDIGIYILHHVNKEIPIDVIMKAVKEVYKKAYNIDENKLDKVIDTVLKQNKRRQGKMFPKTYKIADNKKEAIMNATNKFVFDEEVNNNSQIKKH